MTAWQSKPVRIALKLGFAAALIALLVLMPISEVDFVYTGF